MAKIHFKRLTLRQREVFDFIEKYIAEAGYAPTIAEIAEGFGLSGKAIYDHVNALIRKGMIERREDNVPRGLKLTAFAQLFSLRAQADIQHLRYSKRRSLDSESCCVSCCWRSCADDAREDRRISRRAADSR